MKNRMQGRTEFGELVTGGRLPAIQIATPGCDWNLVARLSHDVPITVLIGGDESPDCSLPTFETIEGQSWWLPAGCRRVPEAEDPSAWPHCVSLQRRDVDLGTVQLSGASLRPPVTCVKLGEGEHANRKTLTRLFREDARYLADIVNRRCDDASISVVLTAGSAETHKYSQAAPDVRSVLQELGVQVQQVKKCSPREAQCRALMRHARRALSRYATVHIDGEKVYLPQQALLPYAVHGRRLLGARMPLVDSPAPGIRCVSIADLLYTASSRFPGREPDDTPHLRAHVFAWCHVVAFVVRRLAGSGLSAAVEALPLDALASERCVVVSVFVQGIAEEGENEMGREFAGAIGRTPYAGLVLVNVLGVESVDQVRATVRTLSPDAIECIHGALMDDADSFRPYESATVARSEAVSDGFMIDRRVNDIAMEYE